MEKSEIEGVIGQGSSGVVYRGRGLDGDGTRAIKILAEDFAHDRDAIAYLLDEVKAAGRLQHPNIAATLELGVLPDGSVFLAMEYLEGESLRDRLAHVQRLPLFEAINILRQVAHGLGAAHVAGFAHGNLKPSNIFLCKRKGRRRIVRRSKAAGMRLVVEPEDTFDMVKLLDFGMAKFLDVSLVAQVRSGAKIGIAHYLSPEQAQGVPPSPRSDIYSLGAVFYEMVSGTVPFGGDTLADILKGHASAFITPPSRRAPRAGIDARIDALILRCLMKSPAQRFAGTEELREALDGCVTDCAFLRDAHRLPGIVESGIDLSEALPEARQDPAAATPKPAPVTIAPAPAVWPTPGPAAPAPAPVVVRAVAPVAAPTPAPVAADDPAATAITPGPEILAARQAAEDATQARSARPSSTPAPVGGSGKVEGVTSQAEPSRPETGARAGDAPAEPMVGAGDWDDVLDERPSRGVRGGSRRAAVMGVLLLGAIGIAVWAARPAAQRETKQAIGQVAPAAPAAAPPAPAAVAVVAAPTPAPEPTPAPTPTGVAAPAAAPSPAATPTPMVAGAAAPAAAIAQAPAPAVTPPAVQKRGAPAPALKGANALRAPGKALAARSRPARTLPGRSSPPADSEAVAAPTSEPEVAAAPVQPAPAPAEPAPPVENKASAAPEPTADTAGDLVREAQRAWLRGHYAVAIDKAQAALKAEPTSAQAAQAQETIGAAACAIGDADGAREAASHLGASKREALKAACEKHGVTIE